MAARVIATESVSGGGPTPGATSGSYAVALSHAQLSATELASELRRLRTPVIARIHDEEVLLDLRTIPPAHDAQLTSLLRDAFLPAQP